MTKSPITTHVLDTGTGQPAVAMPVTLSLRIGDQWQTLATGVTDQDGRILNWPQSHTDWPHGTYKLTFDIAHYQGEQAFYPFADICFVRRDNRHHHIPLLLSAFGYSTYRGS